MQITEMSDNKVKITLTDTEVIYCFGAYERLFSMSAKTKYVIKALLSNVIEEHYGFLKSEKISAEIRGAQNIGCIIILSCEKKPKEYILSFENSEQLIKSSIQLYKHLKNKKYTSSLYINNGKYYLLITAASNKNLLSICRKSVYDICSDSIKTEYIKEYGTAISKRNALYKLFYAFSKET